MAVNRELCRRILDAIDAEPDAFDMNAWAWTPQVLEGVDPEEADGAVLVEPGPLNVCGTTMCLAGWAVHLEGWKITNDAKATKDGLVQYVDVLAVDLLGIDDDASVFYVGATAAREWLEENAA